MSGIRADYLAKALGSPALAGARLAKDLTEGDPVTFKAGYTVPNAIIAAREIFPEATEAAIRKANGWDEGVSA